MNYDLGHTWPVQARHGINGWPSPAVIGWVARTETDHGIRFTARDAVLAPQRGGDGWDPAGDGYRTPVHAADAVYRHAAAMGWATDGTEASARDDDRAEANRIQSDIVALSATITELFRIDNESEGTQHSASDIGLRIQDLKEEQRELYIALGERAARGQALPDAWRGGAFG